MIVYRNLADVPADFGPCALTIGNFDGVHFGHRRILRRLKIIAVEKGWKASVLTFDPHPTRVVAPQHTPALMTSPDRRAQRALQAQQSVLQREQLAQKRDLAQQQKLGVTPAAAQRTAAAAAVQTAARGRFAARFRNNADPRAQVALAARLNGWAPRNAWRHHVHAAFVPWLGPVFWPYVYADIFAYTFWPQAYDDAYWAYAYDDLIDTVFWDPGNPYSAYASIAPDGSVAPDG